MLKDKLELFDCGLHLHYKTEMYVIYRVKLGTPHRE